jgi:hypothetical protein
LVPIFFLFIALFSFQARAGFFKDIGDELASPVTTDAKYYLLSGVALTAILSYDTVEDRLGHDIQNEAVKDKPLGKYSKYGDLAGQMIPNALYFSTLYGMYYFTDNLNYRRKSLLMLKATAYTGVLATAIKYIVREPRPNINNNHRDSFPSGHTTSIFAFASVVGIEHGCYWGIAAYAMAGFVAYSRINDNAHRLHDVVGGATLGLSYGLGLHYLNSKRASQFSKVYLNPSYDGLLVGYRTNF